MSESEMNILCMQFVWTTYAAMPHMSSLVYSDTIDTYSTFGFLTTKFNFEKDMYLTLYINQVMQILYFRKFEHTRNIIPYIWGKLATQSYHKPYLNNSS